MASLPQKGKDDIASTISKLSISSAKQAAPSKKSKEPVADSWEDEDVSDDEAAEAEQVEEQGQSKDADADAAGTSTPSSLATPAVPPPTPASPLGYESPHEWASLASQSQSQSQSPMATTASASATGSGSGTPARRPEKTDAVARRLIAAGLGIKAPRQTEEQRAYQRSVREQEKKRREEAKAEEERRRAEEDKAKMAVWED
ncbi:hypothetical protein TRIATDRAFT_320595 [Trichoderma atroviride IMI 206040]|uniref:Ubiquitin-like protein smt3 n=1 Tax=Hypocrea atroviridis (strain ATCC 20476 / IMI 206040) TaxID=452589 RepID=G9P1C2_HYPAI|nr:uncharacterized protein TRIATDRAFT_320595 [Trichoderma atroviride IMI 206040]EHK43310.1 hypothetical protein TRIATDRAFT_320595 [Trichoderma atroviride IMI 206040]